MLRANQCLDVLPIDIYTYRPSPLFFYKTSRNAMWSGWHARVFYCLQPSRHRITSKEFVNGKRGCCCGLNSDLWSRNRQKVAGSCCRCCRIDALTEEPTIMLPLLTSTCYRLSIECISGDICRRVAAFVGAVPKTTGDISTSHDGDLGYMNFLQTFYLIKITEVRAEEKKNVFTIASALTNLC